MRRGRTDEPRGRARRCSSPPRWWLGGGAGVGVRRAAPASATTSGVYGLCRARTSALPERHATDLVSAMTFDYRGFDTLGEEFILFVVRDRRAPCCCARSAASARSSRADGARRGSAPRGVEPAARARGRARRRRSLVLGGYVVAHGHLTPGGGFQGGVILAAALVLVFIAGQLRGAAPRRGRSRSSSSARRSAPPASR